jgi:prophage antirepressor-like protein
MNQRRKNKELKHDSRQAYKQIRKQRGWFFGTDICRAIGLNLKRRDWLSQRLNNLVLWGVMIKNESGRQWKWKYGKKGEMNQKKFVMLMTKHPVKQTSKVKQVQVKVQTTVTDDKRSEVLKRLREQADQDTSKMLLDRMIKDMPAATKWHVFKRLNQELNGKE